MLPDYSQREFKIAFIPGPHVRVVLGMCASVYLRITEQQENKILLNIMNRNAMFLFSIFSQ